MKHRFSTAILFAAFFSMSAMAHNVPVLAGSKSGSSENASGALKPLEVSHGGMKLTLDGDRGVFSLSALPESGSPIKLFSNYEYFFSTYFSLMAGKKTYILNRRNGFTAEARETSSGAQFAYMIPDEAQVVIDFDFLNSDPSASFRNVMKVSVYVINISPETKAYSLKGIFDTVLGESSEYHFSTAARKKIGSSKVFSSMKDDLWVRSSNSKASVQFLLDGFGITAPEKVILAGKNEFSSSLWIPHVKEGGGFNSVVAYNNSALGVFWPSVYIDPLKTNVTTFYISTATDDEKPAGKEFLAFLDEEKKDDFGGMKVSTTEIAPEPIEIDADGFEKVSRKRIRSVEDIDPEYVRSLVERIKQLTSRDTSREELDALNEELDEILEILGGETL